MGQTAMPFIPRGVNRHLAVNRVTPVGRIHATVPTSSNSKKMRLFRGERVTRAASLVDDVFCMRDWIGQQ